MTSTGLCAHFLHRHVRYNVIIMEKVNLTHPRCPRYDVLVMWVALNCHHPNTSQCDNGEEVDQLTRILVQEGANKRVSGTFFTAVVQAFLLFVPETRLATPRMGWSLRGFQNRVAWSIMGNKTHQLPDGRWEYPPPPNLDKNIPK